jgi:uncharacterized repeat protein (TIGR01451 family)
LVLVAGLLLFPMAALANHNASDFFIFSRAEFGKFAETNCNASNDKQADVSGSTVGIFGRIHSHADFAASGQNITFNSPVTYGKHDGPPPPCQAQPEAQNNTYLAGPPTNIAGDPPGLDAGGWPGNLSLFLNPPSGGQTHPQTFSTIGQVLPGETCDVGSLSGTSDITLTQANSGQVVCNGTGKVQLAISGQNAANPLVMSITIVSHGSIEISGQHVSLTPATHGVLAWTDQNSSTNDVSIKLAGSNFDVPERAILFTPRSGQDISGSEDSELCIQVIGQGRNKVAGSSSTFGPGLCETLGNPDIVTEATNATIGNPISDTATLSNMAPGGTGGSITFRAWNNSSCQGAPVFTSQAFTANEDGVYGPASFTPTAAGSYYWIASFSGNTANNGVSGNCGDPGEVSVVAAASPGITTVQTPTVARFGDTLHDSAQLSNFSGSSLGSVTFRLFPPNDNCSNVLTAVYSETVPVDNTGAAATVAGTSITALQGAGTYHWVAAYSGNGNNNPTTSGCNDEPVRVIDPKIEITKTADAAQYLQGQTVTFTIRVENTGDSDLTDVTVTDPVAPNCDRTKNDIPALALMEPGDVVTYTCTMQAPAEDTTNTATASGKPETGPNVTDSDDEPVNVISPQIDIEKTVEDDTLSVGDTAEFHIVVTNTGDVPLTNIVVTDALAPDCARTAAQTLALIQTKYGVANVALQPGQSFEYDCELQNVQFGFDHNTAAVSGQPPIGPPVTDEDTVPVTVKSPSSVGTAQSLLPNDTATVTSTNGPTPTGSVTFTLWGPNNANCSGTPVYTQGPVPLVNGVASTSNTSTVVTAEGVYRWKVTYGGDANNDASESACGVEQFTLDNDTTSP